MIPQLGNQVSIFHDNNGPRSILSRLHRVNVVPGRNGTRQTLICIVVVKSKRCPTWSTLVLVATTLCYDEAVVWRSAAVLNGPQREESDSGMTRLNQSRVTKGHQLHYSAHAKHLQISCRTTTLYISCILLPIPLLCNVIRPTECMRGRLLVSLAVSVKMSCGSAMQTVEQTEVLMVVEKVADSRTKGIPLSHTDLIPTSPD